MFQRILLTAVLFVPLPVWADGLTFERDVRPILKAHCFQCHGEEEKPRGGLDVRLVRLLKEGGNNGPAINLDDAHASLLIERLRSGDMPPGDDPSKKVPADQIDIIARWIVTGAKTARAEPEQITDADLITEEERAFWAFQPVSRPNIPEVRDPNSIRSPIDAFIQARLDDDGLSLSPPASPVTTMRRLVFDLSGVPPSPEDVTRFVEDERPDAWERLVDRSLASPSYGERWGRHWLDVVGYADSEGYTDADVSRPWAWKYRDYVIDAFDADKPFDEFIREQLAGDEMVRTPYAELPPEEVSKLVATGFLRMAPDGTSGGVDDINIARNDAVADAIEVVSTSLLGLTVGCARCHDHRFDPIPTRDYYRMRAILEPGFDWEKWRAPKSRLVSLYSAADRAEANRIEAEAKQITDARAKKQQEFIDATLAREIEKLPENIREMARTAVDTPAKNRTKEQNELIKKHPSLNVTPGSLYLYDRKAADELKKMADQADALRATKPKEEFVRALTEVPGRVPKSFVFHRGDHEQPQDEVEPADLTVLTTDIETAKLPINDPRLPTTGRRLAWAHRLTDGTHPLVGRVLVNRFWMHHFGRGLVNSPGDFGLLGDRPTHPELLDYLASEFVTHGWSAKRFHREILTSAVYMQAGANGPTASERARTIDPDVTLYWQFPMQRLEAETFRDSVLAVADKLNQKRLGAPIPVMADQVGQYVIGKENLNAGRPGPVLPMHGEDYRKTIYVEWRRSRPLTVLDTFDLPRMEPNCTKRPVSTVATQSLFLMNSTFIIEMSEHVADRVRREAEAESDQVRLAWRLAFVRDPTDAELSHGLTYLNEQSTRLRQAKHKDPARASLASLCQGLLSSNEFLYVD